MAEVFFINSDKIHIFPCANRGNNIDLAAKVNTEYNLINLPSLLSASSNYTLEKTSDMIRFVIHGYYVEVQLIGFSDSQLNNLWVNCKTTDSTLWLDGTNEQKTKVLCDWTLSNGSPAAILDKDGKFYGIAFSTESFGDNCLQILKDGNLINNSPISLKQLGSIIEAGSAAQNGISINLTQNQDTGKLKLELTSSTVTYAQNAVSASSASYATSAASATYATTAGTSEKIGTKTVGSTTKPVYINNGIPTAIGYTINKSVPSDAKFTDTTYTAASTTTAGLMSSDDKSKLDSINVSSISTVSGESSGDTWSTITINGTKKSIPSPTGLTTASTSSLGGIKLFSGTTTYIDANNKTKFKVQLGSEGSETASERAYVDVPVFSTSGPGLVPAPGSGWNNYFLAADGQWHTPTNTWKQNTSSQEGYVIAPGTGNAYKVWKVGSNNNPGWYSDTVRAINVNGATVLSDGNYSALNLVAGSNVTLTGDTNSGKVTITASNTDTKNTAGNSTTTSKVYLVGTTSTGTTYGQTYANSSVYMQSGKMYASSFYASSDKRLKENIKDYTCNKSILDLPIKKYDYIDGEKNQIGCLAQDLQEICPEIVTENENGYLSIQESKITYLLLQEIKRLEERISKLEKGE